MTMHARHIQERTTLLRAHRAERRDLHAAQRVRADQMYLRHRDEHRELQDRHDAEIQQVTAGAHAEPRRGIYDHSSHSV
jgi:hypothetical protein